ncbi:TetR family transcriptional regulator [Streptomyces sp. 150FB]|uniref:TetR/AcrR family transcriptional regulator n=1 Tax=Streptomyces sp. 150FB TaxID=1576605 RepID=UPI0005890F00|nr:TetR/AcrR family transcriptional regulator [Streptomyces sp. 150FB]KIF77882.1 TetR family transcriptional regulator [Streptomyces sp. 150FB]
MKDDEPRPRRLTRAETKARTRSLLLDAAARVFARKGYAGASVEEIAESAGFSTGALYSNFASKDELFIELLSSRSSSRLAEAATIVSDPKGSIEDSRKGLSQLLLDVADKDRDLAPLQAEFWLYAIRRPEFQEHLVAQFRTHRDALSGVLADRAEGRGQSGEAPFDDVATVVLALFQGLVQLRRVDPALVPEELYGTAVHWLFVGLNASLDPSRGGKG